MVMRDQGELQIGEVLKSTRMRLRLDIATVENETKIRTKYLRALENEEWEALPGPTYVRGFLRTYAGYLGLDADALVDEYRRTIEHSPATEQPYLFSESLLERRRRPVEQRRGSGGYALLALAIVGVLTVIALVALGVLGGSSDPEGGHRKPGRHHGQHHASKGSKQGSQGKGDSSGQAVSLALITHDEMVVCLLPGHGRPLIDSQTLVADSKQGPFVPPAENYRLDLISGGAVTVVLGGKPQRVQSKRPASFHIDDGGIRPISYQGQKCP
jgi:hypothetical protein